MQMPAEEIGPSRRYRMIKIGSLLGLACIIATAAAWFFTPRLTEHLLTQQLERVEARTGLEINTESLQTAGLHGLEVRGLEMGLPGKPEPLATIDAIDATADLFRAARGQPAVTALTIDGVHLSIHRRADGTSNLDSVLASLRAQRDDASEHEEDLSKPDDALEEATDRLLRHFGGRYPDVVARDLVVDFTHHEDSSPWPVRRLSSDEFSMNEDGGDAPFSVAIDIDAPKHHGFQLPTHVNIAGTMKRPVDHSTAHVEFEPELRVLTLPGLPHTEFSVRGVAIPEEYTVEVIDVTLDSHLREEAYRLASADRVLVQLNRWSRSPDDLSLLALEIDGPELYIEHGSNGAMNLAEFYSIARQPAANMVTENAHQMAEALDTAELEGDEEDADHDEDEQSPDEVASSTGAFARLQARLAGLPIREFLTEYLPRETKLRDLRLVVKDSRIHDQLTRPATDFAINGEVLKLRHSPLNGLLEGDFRFQTEAGNDIGHADIQFEIPYRRGDWNASVDVDSIELALFSQLGGSRLANYLHGGEITATLDIENENEDDESLTRFDGLLATQELRVHFGAIAEDPIEVSSASLRLDGYYDPTMPVPSPRLIEIEDEQEEAEQEEHAEDDIDEADSPPMQGAFVLNDAVARLNEVEATIGFFVYGIDGTRRPNRTGMTVELEPTRLQAIADSVPPALRGPLDGIEMAGSLSWDFDLEIPLYEASNMAWDADVALSPDFEIVYLPEEVDVFKLTEEFEHTISEEWKQTIAFRQRELSYERRITIPEMRPTPATWLLENTSLDLERIDTIRRRRGWPEIPPWSPSLEMTRAEYDSPEYWLSAHALSQSADKPWDDTEEEASTGFWSPWESEPREEPEFIDTDEVLPVEEMVFQEPDPLDYQQTEIEIDPDRHGTYVYVPLHHISPYVIRAIMTTEDTSFFRHSGFNYLAIRQSVEANLEAGEYVRGASTISMQLAKNLFLDRSRVLSRKLQEVTLVWLMESVADIPKERMFELYLNIIEFGPGIYGIHEASVYYFGKRPDELTISEVAWLVSIVPSPKRFHRYYDAGEINAYWFRRMSRYIRAMYYRERISEEEMEAAFDDKPSFYFPEEGDPMLRAQPTDDIAPELEIDSEMDQLLDLPGF